MMNKCFVPFPELETERLILRQVMKKDADQLYEMLSEPEVAKYDYFYPVTSKAEALIFVERFTKELEEKEEITWGGNPKRNESVHRNMLFGRVQSRREKSRNRL